MERVYPYAIKCKNCGHQDGMRTDGKDLSHLECSKCKKVGTNIYLKRSKKTMAKKKAKKKVARKTAKKTTKKTAKRKPIRDSVLAVLAKTKTKLTIRQVYEKVNASRKADKVSIFGVRRICDLLPAKLRKQISKRKMG